MSRVIVRESSRVRPWQQMPLGADRPAAMPAGGSSDPIADEPVPSFRSPGSAAEEIVQNARRQAERLLQEVREEADQLRAAACERGLAEGQARGLEEYGSERRRLQELLAQLAEAYRRFCRDQVPELALLATAAAEKLLHEQLTLEPARVVTIVRRAMEELVGSVQITLHMHPDDLELVRTLLASSDSPRGSDVQWVADPSVERGGCWIESETGQVDATVAGRVAGLNQVVSGP